MDVDTVNYAKGETTMTDYQFQRYEELRDKYDAAKKTLDSIHQLAQSISGVDNSPEEILAAIASMTIKYKE